MYIRNPKSGTSLLLRFYPQGDANFTTCVSCLAGSSSTVAYFRECKAGMEDGTPGKSACFKGGAGTQNEALRLLGSITRHSSCCHPCLQGAFTTGLMSSEMARIWLMRTLPQCGVATLCLLSCVTPLTGPSAVRLRL